MSKREKNKIIEIAGRKWRIEKFDALTGSYIAYKVMGSVLPMGIDNQITEGNAPKDRTMMSKPEFLEIQMDCLRVCYEVLPAGGAPVIGENGSWGVTNIETDTMTVLMLTIHALIFNISGFFDGNALKDLAESFKGMIPFNAPTSTNGPTPQ